MHYQAHCISSKNVHSDCSYDSTSNTENVSERSISCLAFRSKHNSDHAVPTAATYSVGELS
jgi:hypothetical protein